MASWQEKIDADTPVSARFATHQMAVSSKPRRGAAVLACKFVVDLANIDILAAIACLPDQNDQRPGHGLYVNTP
ncbi:MAG: hypothetical protein ACHQAY_07165 [Hyphomicrobiales bacterium]